MLMVKEFVGHRLRLDALATTAHRRHGSVLFRFLAGTKTYNSSYDLESARVYLAS
jgi:hypothetical protein